MANAKAKRKTIPGKTKTGKTKFVSLSLSKLQEALQKANRNKDKDKIQRVINNLTKRGFTLKEQEA